MLRTCIHRSLCYRNSPLQCRQRGRSGRIVASHALLVAAHRLQASVRKEAASSFARIATLLHFPAKVRFRRTSRKAKSLTTFQVVTALDLQPERSPYVAQAPNLQPDRPFSCPQEENRTHCGRCRGSADSRTSSLADAADQPLVRVWLKRLTTQPIILCTERCDFSRAIGRGRDSEQAMCQRTFKKNC
jgi:hypothetical protein